MKTVTVNASKKYDILIGSGLINQLGTYIQSVHTPCKAAIVTDSTVCDIYLQRTQSALRQAGFDPVPFIFPAGEISKNTGTYLDILNFLAENRISRGDILIALGGGVVGDMAGFAAATYLRGIPYVQVPTTLLAMVDSSVGGKTAIDLPAGKNLVGAFYHPELVICDVDALDSLPARTFTDGCAEVIKYAILYDQTLFAHLLERGPSFDRRYVISRCVALKAEVVCNDEFDTGARQKLNLGHTFGHSIEKLSQYSISHGSAVAMGLNMSAKASVHMGLCVSELPSQIQEILVLFGLDSITPFHAKDMAEAAQTDKKRFGDKINIVLPCSVGNCVIYPVPVDQLETIFEAGL